MRVFYFYPSFRSPSGGNKQLRLQGLILKELGYEVHLVRDADFFEHPVHFQDDHLYGSALPIFEYPFLEACSLFKSDDVLVLPEGKLDSVLPSCAATLAKIVINNQNGFYALRYFPKTRSLRKRVDFVISNSQYNCTVSRVAYEIHPNRVFYVPHWVVRGPFEDVVDSESKAPGICYMPRKMPSLVQKVKREISQRFPSILWVEIDGLPEDQVACRLKSHAMFFAAQHLEGCPLTALEAMACSSIVSGFPGTEGFRHPYATPLNGYWANDNDIESAIGAVSRMILDYQSNSVVTKEVIACGLRTVANYSKQPVKQALERFAQHCELIVKSGHGNKGHRNPVRTSLPEEEWSWRDYWYSQRKMIHYQKLGYLGKSISVISNHLKRFFASVL